MQWSSASLLGRFSAFRRRTKWLWALFNVTTALGDRVVRIARTPNTTACATRVLVAHLYFTADLEGTPILRMVPIVSSHRMMKRPHPLPVYHDPKEEICLRPRYPEIVPILYNVVSERPPNLRQARFPLDAVKSDQIFIRKAQACFSPGAGMSSPHYYLPGRPPCCDIAAFCSWNRSPNRCDPFMCLSTHRMMQLSSREVRDLLSKPLTQWSKHCWTRFEYICWTTSAKRVQIQASESAYIHKLLHLLLLHAILQLALFRCRESARN